MRRLILLVFLISLAGAALAQVSPQIQGAGPPTNPCYNGGQQYVDQTNKVIYNCSVPGQNWVNIGLGNLTNSGGVSSFNSRTGAITPTLGDYTSATLAGVTGSGAEAIQGFTLSPFCPTANTGQCFNTAANTQQAVDCSWTSGSTAVTCASSHFVAADVGKRVFGYTTCNAFTSTVLSSNATSGAMENPNQGGSQKKLTITAQSGTGLTLSQTADNTVSGNTHCLIWGTPDDAGAALMDTAIQAANFCPRALLIASNYMFTDPHFYTQPTACSHAGSINSGSLGNTYYSAGFEIEGRGAGATLWYLTPGFPENTSCNHGNTNVACFVRTLLGRWKDFQITGAQNPTGSNGNTLIEVDGPGSMDNFTCLNWGAGNTTTIGMFIENFDQSYQLNNSACGYIGIETGGTQPSWIGIKVRVENSPNALTLSTGNQDAACYDCEFDASQGAAPAASTGIITNAAGGSLTLYHSNVINPASVTGIVGYLAKTIAGSQLRLIDSYIYGNSAATFTAFKSTAASTLVMHNGNLNATSGTAAYVDAAGSVLVDECGSSTQGTMTISGRVQGSCSITSTSALATGNVAITSCGTSTAGTFSGSSQKGQFTITFAGTPGTTCTATVTYPTAFWQTPVCNWYVQGGTNSPATTVALGAQSATSTAVTFSGPTFTAANTMIVGYTCINP